MNARLHALLPPKTWFPGLLVIVVLLTGYRFFALSVSDLQLYFDEAYYWGWSQHLAFGYYSKPPMIAWTIRAATSLCGNGELCIHTPPLLLFGLTTLVIHAAASRLYNPRVGFVSALIFITLPLVSFYSWLMTTDVLLLFFWASAFYFFIRALDTNRWRDWLGMGTLLGFGLLSKYTAALFLVSALIALLLIPRYRHHLKNPKAGFALVVAFLIFSPNLIWNSSMQFASFRHTAEIAHWQENRFHPDHLLEFIGVQFLLYGPVLSGLVILLAKRMRTRLWHDEGVRLILAFTLPIFLLYSLQAFIAKANYNWAAAGFVSASILGGMILVTAGERRWILLAILINGALGALTYHYGSILEGLGIPLSKKTDIYYNMKGWRELGQQIQAVKSRYPEAALLCDNRRILAELNYYMTPQPPESAIWNPDGKISDHYRLTADLDHATRSSFLFVAEKATADQLRKHFRTVLDLGAAHVTVHQDHDLKQQLYYVEGFSGY